MSPRLVRSRRSVATCGAPGKAGQTTVDLPVIEQLADIDLEESGDLVIRPRLARPQLAMAPYLALEVPQAHHAQMALEPMLGRRHEDPDAAEHADRDAGILYDKLEHKVLPLFYADRSKWIWMMKQSISKIAYYFNSHRMMRRYAAEAYLR